MAELRIWVPTYFAQYNERHKGSTRLDFDQPLVPILATEAEGLRVVLGSHRYDDRDAPDIAIERRPRGWAIFLHPLGGGDPSGYVYFLDDGRSFIIPESGLSTPAIEVIDSWMRELDEDPDKD
jgi:hypothetical protein